MTLCENEGEDFDELLKTINEIMCKTEPDTAVAQSVWRAGVLNFLWKSVTGDLTSCSGVATCWTFQLTSFRPKTCCMFHSSRHIQCAAFALGLRSVHSHAVDATAVLHTCVCRSRNEWDGNGDAFYMIYRTSQKPYFCPVGHMCMSALVCACVCSWKESLDTLSSVSDEKLHPDLVNIYYNRS